ncbi:MAG: hypothetical protein LH629_11285 [Ignavibacteria bacterium]|nr:hypothetical protein [Ignavibacteria bacterium]
MNISNIDEKKLYEIIKSAVTEAVREELLNFKLNSIPTVDDKEMKEIEEDLKKEKDFHNQEYRELKL